MPSDQDTELREQRRVARKYRLLGYDVQENPAPDALPPFLRGLSPDIVARSPDDNVVVEVKYNAALKGSNDLVRTAEAVAGHEDWRFELVTLGTRPSDEAGGRERDFSQITQKVNAAIGGKLYDLAFVYLAEILVQSAHDLARAHKLKRKAAKDRDVFLDLGFMGVMPDEMVQKCLDALTARSALIRPSADAREPREGDVTGLLELCQQVRDLA
jgi:hypothetical protein